MSRLALSFLAAGALLAAATPEEIFRSIRQNDLPGMKRLLGADVEAVRRADGKGTTPLHYAAAFGSTEAVRILLGAGADANARNVMDATPLVLAATSSEKVALLLPKTADIDAATKIGRTALLVAATCPTCTESVRLLLAAGAKVETADFLGNTPLLLAAGAGHAEAVKMLVAKGARTNVPSKAGMTALAAAAGSGNPTLMKTLLGSGGDINMGNTVAGKVKHGPIALTNLTPLVLAAATGSADMVQALLAGGSNPNVHDGRGLTPLMAAVATENQNTTIVGALLKARADPNAKDTSGETVLDWAAKYAHPPTLKMLAAAGAKSGVAPVPGMKGRATPVAPREAVEQALGLLARSSNEFFKMSGCVGCHHQPLTERAWQAAAKAGIRPAGRNAKEELARDMLVARTVEPGLLQLFGPGGGVDSVASITLGFEAAGLEANPLSDAALHYIAASQEPNGSWVSFGVSRVPMEDSTLTRTALAVKAMQAYAWPAREAEFRERVAKARKWMAQAEARNSYERAEQLLGLKWSGAASADLARVAGALKRDQRTDGGWAQNAYLAPDAYATSIALYALHESGQMTASDAAYRRGVEFLLRSQMDDGSWHVRSRSPKFQPYFQSGFPHEHDQWISAAATAYAVMAIAPAAAQ